MLYILVFLLLFIVAPALWAIATYNGLVKRKNLVEEGWSSIDTFLKQRTNLIPNLVETVKGYMTHERDTLEKVTELRAKSLDATTVEEQQSVERALTSALADVRVAVEAYPDLKASGDFQSLQDSLDEIEEKIQLARRYYNGTVRDLNTMIESFPSNFVANFFGFGKAKFFEVENSKDRAVPPVKFGS